MGSGVGLPDESGERDQSVFCAGYVSSGYKDVIGFLLIILLLWRPQGLFGKKSAPQ